MTCPWLSRSRRLASPLPTMHGSQSAKKVRDRFLKIDALKVLYRFVIYQKTCEILWHGQSYPTNWYLKRDQAFKSVYHKFCAHKESLVSYYEVHFFQPKSTFSLQQDILFTFAALALYLCFWFIGG